LAIIVTANTTFALPRILTSDVSVQSIRLRVEARDVRSIWRATLSIRDEGIVGEELKGEIKQGYTVQYVSSRVD
jgi:hypothetical protein